MGALITEAISKFFNGPALEQMAAQIEGIISEGGASIGNAIIDVLVGAGVPMAEAEVASEAIVIGLAVAA